MAKSVSEKCISCTAPLKYDSKKDLFVCEYCGNSYTINELETYKKKTIKEEKKIKKAKTIDVDVYNCENCGATIILGDNTSSTSCVYCKSSAIIKNRLTGVYAPSKIITFKFSKEDAINSFKNLCKGRKLMPKGFDDLKNIQGMEGLYVPFWLYDCKNDAIVHASCEKESIRYDSNYVHTITEHYKVTRSGNLTFENIPNDAASRFDDNIMHAIEPFDYSKFKEFNASYLSGYISEKYDVNLEDAYRNVLQRINNDSKNYLLSQIKGYSRTSIDSYNHNIEVTEHDYVLLPVWVLNIKFKGKIYRFSMNGQTGKFVGEIPVDKMKLFILIIMVFSISFLLLLGVAFLFGGVK